ncbi:MAG: nuclear transport factor 2 family protein [Ramlibacter sp.]|jgi:steroid delta-isomerase|nr:nuclear transport factor 2 family protein [Ramlibacter sp.]
MTDATDRIVRFFEALEPADLPRLSEIYSDEAVFKDPFNEVRGVPAIQRIFAHMFESLDEPRFRITARIAGNGECFLAWEFTFRMRRLRRGVPQCIRGGSHLQLAPDGRITLHRDYWDAAEELYEKLPGLGMLMRWLRRSAAT